MLAVRLDAETERRLDALAARTGRTKTFYAREAINAHPTTSGPRRRVLAATSSRPSAVSSTSASSAVATQPTSTAAQFRVCNPEKM